MIQRIQTIYLLIAAILIGLVFALPVAQISANGQNYVLTSSGSLHGGILIHNWVALVILIVHAIAIFSFKKRKNQIKVVVAAIILLVVQLGLFCYFAYIQLSNATVEWKLAAVFPLLAIIFDFLAIRTIRKDEALVRSLDRIR
jgi:hypothetical protein